MKTRQLTLLLILNFAFTGTALAQFQPGCTVPFKLIQTVGLDVDSQCDINGGSEDDAKKAESSAKNNFCVDGTPMPITYSMFTKLESKSTDEIRSKVKEDRNVLKDFVNGAGEGTLVRFVAFVLDAHASNVKKAWPHRRRQ